MLVSLAVFALGNTCATAPERAPQLDLPESRERAYSALDADAVRHVVERRCMVCHVSRWGVRRSSPRFWPALDWFQDRLIAQDRREAGVLDWNRYANW